MPNSTTISRRLAQLIDQIENHPHKDEILRLALEQSVDDVDNKVCNEGVH